jgi:hypothetical protein
MYLTRAGVTPPLPPLSPPPPLPPSLPPSHGTQPHCAAAWPPVTVRPPPRNRDSVVVLGRTRWGPTDWAASTPPTAAPSPCLVPPFHAHVPHALPQAARPAAVATQTHAGTAGDEWRGRGAPMGEGTTERPHPPCGDDTAGWCRTRQRAAWPAMRRLLWGARRSGYRPHAGRTHAAVTPRRY